MKCDGVPNVHEDLCDGHALVESGPRGGHCKPRAFRNHKKTGVEPGALCQTVSPEHSERDSCSDDSSEFIDLDWARFSPPPPPNSTSADYLECMSDISGSEDIKLLFNDDSDEQFVDSK